MLLAYIAILRSSRPEVSCKKGVLKHIAKFTGKLLYRSLFFHKVAGRLEKRLQCTGSEHLLWFFRTPILYNERLLLVLVRIGLVWRAANLSMFFIIVCKSVFEVLGYSFQLILH